MDSLSDNSITFFLSFILTPAFELPPHRFSPWTARMSSTRQRSPATPGLTFGEVALLPHTDLGRVDQVADGNGPAHRGAHAGVTGAALVHLQQGQV